MQRSLYAAKQEKLFKLTHANTYVSYLCYFQCSGLWAVAGTTHQRATGKERQQLPEQGTESSEKLQKMVAKKSVKATKSR